MIVEKALRLAGPGSMLVARPHGVPHVYVGPLTPSGRYVPSRSRTVCRVHSRRLGVVREQASSCSLAARGGVGRLCARCSACLSRLDPPTGRPGSNPVTRVQLLEAYAGTSKADVAFALELATTPDEVAAAAHLSLLLFGVGGCNDGFTDRGRIWSSLHQLVCTARARVDGYPPDMKVLADRQYAYSLMGREQRTRERRQIYADREARIKRIGINNALP